MDSIFRDVVTEAKGLVGAQATRMFLVVDTPDSKMPSALTLEEGGDQYLYGKYVTSSDMAKETRIKLGRGIVSRAVLTGEAVNVYEYVFLLGRSVLVKNSFLLFRCLLACLLACLRSAQTGKLPYYTAKQTVPSAYVLKFPYFVRFQNLILPRSYGKQTAFVVPV
jgi:hypothetical protein